jgi:hypothetical protein
MGRGEPRGGTRSKLAGGKSRRKPVIRTALRFATDQLAKNYATMAPIPLYNPSPLTGGRVGMGVKAPSLDARVCCTAQPLRRIPPAEIVHDRVISGGVEAQADAPAVVVEERLIGAA